MISTTDNNLPGILLLEDDGPTISILNIWLRGICRITTVTDGDTTLKVLTENLERGYLFELMLFDINIPFPWNGLTLKEEILRRYKPYARVPFVAETAYAMPSDRDRLLAAGFVDYLSKPLERELLVRTVQKHLCAKSLV